MSSEQCLELECKINLAWHDFKRHLKRLSATYAKENRTLHTVAHAKKTQSCPFADNEG